MMREAEAIAAAEAGCDGEAYQLGPAQRIWARAAPSVRCLVLRFDRKPDPERLRRALVATGTAYEALRTRFPARPGLTLPVQVIDPAQPPWLEAATLDPGGGPVVAATLGDGGSELSLRALALALDRRSLLLWAQAIGAAYHGMTLPDTIQPADAAEGLAALESEASAGPAGDFWRQALAEGEPPGRLPNELVGSGGTCAALRRRWEALPVPLSPPRALALWQTWLARETGLARVTVGVELTGRDAELIDAIGCYARPVPCTLRLDRGAGLDTAAAAAASWLDRAGNWMLAAPDPDGPATDRIGGLNVFPYGFSDRTDDPEIDWASLAAWREQAELPCRLGLHLLPDGFRLVYDTGRFSAGIAAQFADRFAGFVANAVADSRRPLARLPRLPAAADIARRGKGPPLAPDAAGSILDLIAAMAADRPGNTALTDPAGNRTYAQFWNDAGRIAARIAAEGFARGSRVALVAPPSAAAVTALIGILRSGAVAVPVDPAYPTSRQAMLIEDAAAGLALIASTQAPPPPIGCRTLTIEAALEEGDEPADPPPPPGRKDGAYLIHTSGSTGRPKGVLVSHGNLLASTRARLAYYAAAPAIFLLTPSLSFDSSVAGLYWTLATGGRLLLPAPGEQRDPGALARLVAHAGASHWLTVPALYQAVLEAARGRELASLTDVIVAGEACPPGLVPAHAAQLPGARLHNEYGPTEATVWCTGWSWTADAAPPDPVPIGRPIAGAAIHILDEQGELAPDGAPGEIHVGGAGVTAGYPGDAAATAAAFLPDPFAADPGARMYRTGDRGLRRSDGTILYLGRVDRQIKIGGRRVEPGEIEAQIDALPGCARSVVVMRDGRLTGYVQRRPGAAVDPAGIRAALRAALPEWMVPDAIVALDEFPSGPNGKLDAAALPAPERSLRPAYRAPVGAAARALAEAVGAIVGVADPGLDDDFFALGGDSLMALQVAAQLRGAGFALSVRSIFEVRRLGALAELAVPLAAEHRPAVGDDPTPAPLTPIQRWFLARDLPDPRHYNQAVAFEFGERLALDRLETALARLTAHHPVLRCAIGRTPEGWRQHGRADPPKPPGRFDLRGLPGALRERVLAQKIAELQRGLDPFAGQMLRVGGFRLAADRADLLVVVAHHLAIDARSWHVLAEDLAACYRGREPAPALSFGEWTRALADHAGSAEEDWNAYLAGAEGRLPRDRGTGGNREADAAEMTLTLPAAQAGALVRWPGGRPGRNLSDAVLATLALVLGDWTGHGRLLVDVEGSGRDVPAFLPGPSRTIGWLTTLAPLILPYRPDGTREARLRAAVAAIDASPADWTYALGAPNGPSSGAEFSVNFLGRMAGGGGDALLRPVPLDLGPMRGAENPRAHLIDLEAETGADGLRLLWRYPATLFEVATIRRLAGHHLDLLRELAGTVR
jgi:amino acid adenylation domain-containing protein